MGGGGCGWTQIQTYRRDREVKRGTYRNRQAGLKGPKAWERETARDKWYYGQQGPAWVGGVKTPLSSDHGIVEMAWHPHSGCDSQK